MESEEPIVQRTGLFGHFDKAFRLDIDPLTLTKNVNFLRIVFGLILLHRYLDMLGFVTSVELQNLCLLALFLAACITLGLLTPLCLIIFFVMFCLRPPISSNLGVQVEIINLWALFLLGAGRHYSLDALLCSSPFHKRFIAPLYFLTPEHTPANFALIRLFLLTMFWSLSVGACVYHFRDPLWLEGAVLQIALTTQYLSDHAATFIAFRESFPGLFNFLCTTGLYVQVAFELVLVPAMFLTRWGRGFILVQGLAFFLISLTALNLGYLPIYEIVLWGLVFNYASVFNAKGATLYYDDRCKLCKRSIRFIKFLDFYNIIKPEGLSTAPEAVRNATPGELSFVIERKGRHYAKYDAYRILCRFAFPFILFYPLIELGALTGLGPKIYNYIAEHRARLFGVCEPYTYVQTKREFQHSRVSRPFLLATIALTMVVCVLFNVQNTASIMKVEWSKNSPWKDRPWQITKRALAQGPVNVFNRGDLGLGSHAIVFSEIDDEGTPFRVVPFLDMNGGRLDYLRNDYFYFTRTLRWQRIPKKFLDEEETTPTQLTRQTMTLVIETDLRLTGIESGRNYRVDILKRELKEGDHFYYWGEYAPVYTTTIEITNGYIKNISEPGRWTFDLPPGHFASKKREAKTLKFLQELAAGEPPT